MTSTIDTSKFKIGLGRHLLDGAMTGVPAFWRLLGQLESMVLSEQLEDIEISEPVYVTGLARSGTTILLEILASHQDVVTHRYSDFPGLFTPYWWGRANGHTDSALQERAHGDGLLVNQQSPEAMEEILWMAHFDHLHDIEKSSVLDANSNNPAFEKEYREHIQKLLLLRSGHRYVAKGNYNIARLEYILKLFPDAKFIIPVRHPVGHVASLIKQHDLFCAGQQAHPRSLAHLQRVGHFEFGLDRRAINFGDQHTVDQIESHWQQSESVPGWAMYWAMVYGWISQQVECSPHIKDRVKFVKFEELCGQSEATLSSVLKFSNLFDEQLVDNWNDRLQAPSYYHPQFTTDDLTLIQSRCFEVAKTLGYDSSSWEF